MDSDGATTDGVGHGNLHAGLAPELPVFGNLEGKHKIVVGYVQDRAFHHLYVRHLWLESPEG